MGDRRRRRGLRWLCHSPWLRGCSDGGLLSAELGLRLVPEGTSLALFRFRTGERLPKTPEAYQMLEEVQQRAGQAEQQLQQERERSEQLAPELARLRALLPPPEGAPGPAQP